MVEIYTIILVLVSEMPGHVLVYEIQNTWFL